MVTSLALCPLVASLKSLVLCLLVATLKVFVLSLQVASLHQAVDRDVLGVVPTGSVSPPGCGW